MPQDQRLSSQPVRASFIGARSLGVTRTIDYEDGGIAIQDPSEGLLYQRWRARLLDAGEPTSRVMLSATNLPEFEWFARPDLTEISLAFDQNMRPHLAFVQAGVARLFWYDSQIEGMTTTDLGAGVITPRITMDDKRYIATNGYNTSDIILAYVREGQLCTRTQRQRFTDEIVQTDNVPAGLIKLGMNRQLRLQFLLEV